VVFVGADGLRANRFRFGPLQMGFADFLTSPTLARALALVFLLMNIFTSQKVKALEQQKDEMRKQNNKMKSESAPPSVINVVGPNAGAHLAPGEHPCRATRGSAVYALEKQLKELKK
jgi:hypothetical protein